MPYPPDYRHETRRRILDSARRLFNRNELTEISIDAVMAGAGLTRDGFYTYFASKEELYAEAITHVLRCTPPQGSWQQAARRGQGAGGPREAARGILDSYLSRAHLEDVDNSCPMIGLATDVARGGAASKAAYRQVLDMMVGLFAETLGADGGVRAGGPAEDRVRALALAALCVGGMTLARAVDDPALADELRDAAHCYATVLAGWAERGAADGEGKKAEGT